MYQFNILFVQLHDNVLKGCIAIIIAPFTRHQTNYIFLAKILMIVIRKKKKPDFGSHHLVFPYVLLGVPLKASPDKHTHTNLIYITVLSKYLIDFKQITIQTQIIQLLLLVPCFSHLWMANPSLMEKRILLYASDFSFSTVPFPLKTTGRD